LIRLRDNLREFEQVPCSGYQWCSTCEISALKRKFTEWTSGNIKVDNMIQQPQLLSNDEV
ncbi:33862_t:CDS:2, partial [Gigaspora margarita]